MTRDSESLYELVDRLMTCEYREMRSLHTLRNAVIYAIEQAVFAGVAPEDVNQVLRPLVGCTGHEESN